MTDAEAVELIQDVVEFAKDMAGEGFHPTTLKQIEVAMALMERKMLGGANH